MLAEPVDPDEVDRVWEKEDDAVDASSSSTSLAVVFSIGMDLCECDCDRVSEVVTEALSS